MVLAVLFILGGIAGNAQTPAECGDACIDQKTGVSRPLEIQTCGGAPPPPPRVTEEIIENAKETHAWEEAMAQWGPCPEKQAGAPSAISARALRHHPPKTARSAFERSLRAWRNKQDIEAATYAAEAVRLDPDYFDAYSLLGTVRLRMGQYPQALEALEHAIHLDPANIRLRLQTAGVYLLGGQLEPAEAYARQVRKVVPHNAFAAYLLGLALTSRQQYTVECEIALREAAQSIVHARELLAFVKQQRKAATQVEVER